jgi:hypothetical protein
MRKDELDEILVQILQVLIEIVERSALCPVFRIILQIAQPGVFILPAHEFHTFHGEAPDSSVEGYSAA